MHPYFSPEQSSDIALLKLDEPLEFNDFVKVRFHKFSNLHFNAKISEFNHETFNQPIGLSENRDALENTFVGCFEAGWSQQDQVLSMSFYLDFIQILSRFFPDFIQILS